MTLEAEWKDDVTDLDRFREVIDVLDETRALLTRALLKDAEAAIRWLCADTVLNEIYRQYEIEATYEECEEIFKTGLIQNAASFPAPPEVTQAVARAFDIEV